MGTADETARAPDRAAETARLVRAARSGDREAFGQLVEHALDSIPPELGRLMRNVAVLVEDMGASPNLLGLYTGVPLTQRTTNYAGFLPDRITIYRLPILERCNTEVDVIEMVRVTVVHEVGHHFGLSDNRLRELGYG